MLVIKLVLEIFRLSMSILLMGECIHSSSTTRCSEED